MSDERWKVVQGNCLDVLKTVDSESVDSIVTDPPYGLSNHTSEDVLNALRAWLGGQSYVPNGSGFMGKSWDAFVPGPEVWRECLRVLKPGGHLLVFSGSRTQDLMGISVRIAGFDARDAIQVEGLLSWTYGSGFPKGIDVSKAIDKVAGATREVLVHRTMVQGGGNSLQMRMGERKEVNADITAPSTDEARRWDGWNTSLKPSHEPILVFRKPLIGTVVDNVLKYGTGAMNIDGCRIGTTKRVPGSPRTTPRDPDAPGAYGFTKDADGLGSGHDANVGRWPPNMAFVHTPDCVPDECVDGCPVRFLDRQTGNVGGGFGVRGQGGSVYAEGKGFASTLTDTGQVVGYGDTGGASRFFPQFSYNEDDAPFYYTSKASRSERSEGMDDSNIHPTVKPVDLMRWAAKLVTPPDGLVLDPFNGSGSTGCAAVLEGFRYLGIELSEEYAAIARERINHYSLKARGGVKNPWTSPTKVAAPVTDSSTSLDDLFGFNDE